jgi:hypothetical protein
MPMDRAEEESGNSRCGLTTGTCRVGKAAGKASISGTAGFTPGVKTSPHVAAAQQRMGDAEPSRGDGADPEGRQAATHTIQPERQSPRGRPQR